MKKYIVNAVFFCAVLVPFMGARAASPEITLSSMFATKYLEFSRGFVLHNEPVLQTDLLVTFTNGPVNGLYLDLWNSTGFDRWNNNLGDEIDYGIGWNGTIKGFGAHVGFTYLNEPNPLTFGSGDILYTHVRLTKDFKPFSVTLGYENHTTMPGSDFEGGNLVSLGVSRSFNFCESRFSLTTSLSSIYDFGGFGLDRGFFLKGSAGIGWNINKHLTIAPLAVTYYVPLTVRDSRETDAVLFSGFILKF